MNVDDKQNDATSTINIKLPGSPMVNQDVGPESDNTAENVSQNDFYSQEDRPWSKRTFDEDHDMENVDNDRNHENDVAKTKCMLDVKLLLKSDPESIIKLVDSLINLQLSHSDSGLSDDTSNDMISDCEFLSTIEQDDLINKFQMLHSPLSDSGLSDDTSNDMILDCEFLSTIKQDDLINKFHMLHNDTV